MPELSVFNGWSGCKSLSIREDKYLLACKGEKNVEDRQIKAGCLSLITARGI